MPTNKLPKSLSMEALLAKAFPGDITLGEAKEALKLQNWYQELIRLSKHNRLRIRFFDQDGNECPDEMTLAEFRRINGRIAIDDGEGGIPQPANTH